MTRPAAIETRCDALNSQLSSFTSLEMAYRLLPRFRWDQFSQSLSRQSFPTWESLATEFELWRAREERDDPVAANFFRDTDRRIGIEIDVKKGLESMIEARGWQRLETDDPNSFSPRIDGMKNVANQEAFLSRYLLLDEKSHDIRRLLEEESLEQADSAYAAFKRELRNRIEPLVSRFDDYVSQDEISSARTDGEVAQVVAKQLIYFRNARAAREALVGICYEDSLLQRTLLNL